MHQKQLGWIQNFGSHPPDVLAQWVQGDFKITTKQMEKEKHETPQVMVLEYSQGQEPLEEMRHKYPRELFHPGNAKGRNACQAEVGSRALGWRQEEAPAQRLSQCGFTFLPLLPATQEEPGDYPG